MAHTATINRELEILTHASQEGVAREILQLASDSTATELRVALDRAQGEKRIREVRAGVFKLRAGIDPNELSKSERQALLARIRKAIAGSPPPAQAVTLARLLFNLDSDVSGRTLSAVADVAESARPDEPDAVRSLLEEVLAERAVWLQSTQHNRLALAYAGTLTAKDPPKTWRTAFEECYRTAIDAGDLDATLRAVNSRTAQLIEYGDLREAEAELHHAMIMLGDLDQARFHIDVLSARIKIYQGELEQARDMLEEVIEMAGTDHVSVTDVAESTLNSLLVTQLDPDARERTNERLQVAVRAGDQAEASMAASLAAGLAFIHGDGSEARMLAREASLRGTRIGRNWRDAERTVIECAQALATAELDQFEEMVAAGLETAHEAGNRHAERSLLSLRLRLEILRMDRPALEATAKELQELADGLQAIYAVGITGIQAAADVASAHRPRLIPGLRDAGTYWGLGGLIAALEVLAIGGSRASALSLRAWADTALKQGVVTAFDWPAHLDRVVPLTMLRLGKQQRVPERLAKAAVRAEEMNHPIEAAIARLQYAEVAESLNMRTQGEAPGAAREQAVDTLLEWGIQPEPLSLTAAQAVLRGAHTRRTTDLSKGQAEVLQLLAEGLTYKEAGRRLGLSWRTVQTQAKYAYAKLGAHDRADAIARARRRGEI